MLAASSTPGHISGAYLPANRKNSRRRRFSNGNLSESLSSADVMAETDAPPKNLGD
jgi:hypothetical protein